MTLRTAAFLIALALPLQAALFDWPTENRALLEGRPQDFYMYVNRNFEGEETTPWEGGSFGFVRGPHRSFFRFLSSFRDAVRSHCFIAPHISARLFWYAF